MNQFKFQKSNMKKKIMIYDEQTLICFKKKKKNSCNLIHIHEYKSTLLCGSLKLEPRFKKIKT